MYDDDGKVEAEIMRTETGGEADAVELADEADEDVEMVDDEVEEEGRVIAVARIDKVIVYFLDSF